MSEISLYILFTSSSDTNTPLQECLKLLVRVICVSPPVLLDEYFQFGEEFFDRIEVWRVWRKVDEFYSGIVAQLVDSFSPKLKSRLKDGLAFFDAPRRPFLHVDTGEYLKEIASLDANSRYNPRLCFAIELLPAHGSKG
jgi:hypothetical protein